MKFFEQKLPGVFIIEPEPFADERGMFRRHFCQREFEAHGISSRVAQSNISENKFKHTLRGFHYLLAPHAEAKTISCLAGGIYDIIVDLRPHSPTYLQWQSFELDGKNRRSLHIPPGCANAFLTMEDNSIIHYYFSEFYFAQAERGLRYNDPLFKFIWPVEPKAISGKDKNFPDYTPVK
ncbi:MAG: dTDP-4-dehydrorhamnose 3,5-epimerase family protein [Candidatus Omnitrophica bacterium]|nr:dTDP-4-dehydrorhamnose 3,5-epimerase family protein [Candidatus Omnitrophota bacterium]